MTMRDIKRGVALSGWIVILLVCVVILCAWLWALIRHGTVDKEMTSAAHLALGFLFGAGATLVKELMLSGDEP
jgi:hypothetical protein